MPPMPLDPRRLACFRFEQISPLLDDQLTAPHRRRYMRSFAQIEILWPSGRLAKVSERTLARWLAAYRKDPRLEALLPAQRKPQAPSSVIDPQWLQFALALLEEEPKRSLYFVIQRLTIQFQLDRPLSRASLHRALKGQARYLTLRKRARGQTKLRTRFQASRPHQIWQGDAKAAFRATLVCGAILEFRILSLLDDCTRYILAARIVVSESLAAAVGAFRHAAALWGLPEGFYADRGSCYDADLFRQGLAILGVRRIGTKARNPIKRRSPS